MVELQKATVVMIGNRVKLTGYGMIETPKVDPLNKLDRFSKLQFALDWEFKVQPMGSWSSLQHNLFEGHGFAVSDR